MKLHYRLISLLIAALCATAAFQAAAQVDAQFTQYYEVPNYYNAGAIGTTDYLRIRAGSRMQWTGIPNAPVTFIAAAEMPLKIASKRFGVGLIMQQESMGLYKNMTLGVQAAYKLKLWKGELSIGLQAGVFDESFKGSEVILPDGDDFHEGTDDGIPTTDVHGTSFDLGLGAFYTHRYFRAGISVTHVNEPTITMSTDGSGTENEYEFKAGRIAYFFAYGNIPVKNTLFEIQPSLLVKTDFTFTTAEFTVRARYKKFLTAGLGYRYKDAVSLVLGAEYKDFFLGYSYDYPVSAISRVSNGSHEVWAGYRLKLDLGEKNRHKHKSIRIM